MSVADETAGMIVPIRSLWRVSAYGSPRSRSAIMGAGFWRSSPTEIDFIAPEYKGIVDCCLLCFWWARCDRQLRIVSDHVKKNSVPPPISELNVPRHGRPIGGSCPVRRRGRTPAAGVRGAPR